ncbi:MAG: hypothetical protein CML16_15665 [Pusillimonas sp.]|nr:hypothetical protein [Pusillimonas sp.]MBC42508.1 hypothetical protein [Pusillimonas sp.]HCP78298.1 hypothetical protein [Pusillimonas sp.]|tara:strand:- start:16237 stop:16605 length:369 start_codon:yes stop_codon:yes gene_type:complete
MRISILIVPLIAILLHTSVIAADDEVSTAKSSAPPNTCVDVEVDGYRALSYDCLSLQMTPTPRHTSNNPALVSAEIARQLPNRLGLITQSGTSNRMGNQLGKSAFPQRPPTAQGTSSLLGGK